LSTKGKTETLYSADLIQAISNAISRGRLFDEVSIKNLSGLDKIIVIIRQEDLGQALDNVLQNALDAMSDSSSKKIDISLQKTTGNNIAIMIRDYGDGIPPEIQNQIFKAHISGRNSSGLGLYHAKSLLDPFGGSISLLKSKPQHGSTFQLNLRIANHDQA
jgi:two-component system sensor kinase FixL